MSTACDGANQDSLFSRALAGDVNAFCELVREHEGRLYRQAFALCRDPHPAEDLAQETLIEAWKSLSRYNNACRFSTWLYSILLHRYQKSLRKKGRALRLDDSEPLPCTSSNPAETVARDDEAEQLRAHIEALPEQAREIIRMHFFAGASLTEISIALDIPLGTAKSRLHYALVRLREKITIRSELAGHPRG
jgi:RNA polymerase sigma-70 factor (ECF subfamily)